ncbi:uncharacterized protein LOC110820836 [Carica papaya]|uniref:uncharacterized protein LOC110820836 n=1 Tax=Carica papaya TaxID=3649 RepID=UPI000B8C7360|nr:uncharacterized protein LOC110820836 [Carica papaya]
MALKWVLSSAFTQVFGQSSYDANMSQKEVMACPTSSEVKDVSSFKKKIMAMEMADKKGCREDAYPNGFQMPLHYPRYSKHDYEKMEEWKLDMLLKEYGLVLPKDTLLPEKRAFAMGAFLWADQL